MNRGVEKMTVDIKGVFLVLIVAAILTGKGIFIVHQRSVERCKAHAATMDAWRPNDKPSVPRHRGYAPRAARPQGGEGNERENNKEVQGLRSPESDLSSRPVPALLEEEATPSDLPDMRRGEGHLQKRHVLFVLSGLALDNPEKRLQPTRGSAAENLQGPRTAPESKKLRAAANGDRDRRSLPGGLEKIGKAR